MNRKLGFAAGSAITGEQKTIKTSEPIDAAKAFENMSILVFFTIQDRDAHPETPCKPLTYPLPGYSCKNPPHRHAPLRAISGYNRGTPLGLKTRKNG